MKTFIAAFFALVAGGVAAADVLPERILSGYYGYNVTRKGDLERTMRMVDVQAADRFNSCETKIQARGRHFDGIGAGQLDLEWVSWYNWQP